MAKAVGLLAKPDNKKINDVVNINGLECKQYHYIKSGKVGRPKTYTPEILEKTKKYIYGGHAEYGDVIPSPAGLSSYLSVTKAVVYLWCEEHPEFLDMLNELKVEQERILLSRGLDKTFDNRLTTLVLSQHGYQNSPQNANDGSQQTNVQVNIIAQQIDADTIARIMGNADFALPDQIQHTNVIDVDDDED